MMTTRQTAAGWVIDTTNTVHGMLEQGGICGREVLYSRAQLAEAGIAYDSDPDADYTGNGVSAAEWLIHCVSPARVLRRGQRIQ